MITIAPARPSGNRAARPAAACLLFTLSACGTAPSQQFIEWGSAQTVALDSAASWHAYLADQDDIPAEMLQRLCDEYDFLHVRNAAQWKALCRAVAWNSTASATSPDFRRGSVIGLVARIGEPADVDWPITIDEVRVHDRTAWVRFRFASGLYYPVGGIRHLVATYVPGVLGIQVVQVGRRIFVINSPGQADRFHRTAFQDDQR